MRKFFIFCILSISLHAGAQSDSTDLDPVTVTASLQPRRMSETGRNILTIDGRSFSNLPVHSIDELLRYLPGVEVQMRGPMGAQGDIVLRGGTFQQVLVLVDGVRVNDPNTGHFSSYIPVVPSEIERIEVLKGAASAIYGSEAVGGVIHILTRSFQAKKDKPAQQLSGAFIAGEQNLFNARAGGFFQKNRHALSAGWLSNNTAGQDQRGTRGFIYSNTISLAYTFLINDKWQLSVRGASDIRRFAAQNFYTTFASDTANEKLNTTWTQLRLSYRNGRHHVSLNAGYKEVEDRYAFNKSGIPNSSISTMWQATVQDEIMMTPDAGVTLGMQTIRKGISSNDRGDHLVWQGAAFAVYNRQFFEKLNISPALRLEWNERSGTELIPQLNTSMRLKKWQLRASAGKTIRDADFTERFNNYSRPVVASGRVGNPALEAERSISYEAGADYFGIEGLRISASLFGRQQMKLIDYVVTPYADMPRKDNLVPGGTYALARNIANVRTHGLEADVKYQAKMSSNASLQAGMGFVWLDSDSGGGEPGFYLASHARRIVNVYADYHWRCMQLSATGIYKVRNRQAAAPINATITREYFVVNGRLSANVMAKKLCIFVQADNVFDRHYADLLGSQMPGRWMMAGISFQMQ